MSTSGLTQFIWFPDPQPRTASPSNFLAEIKVTLGDEESISSDNKNVVFEALERLAKRLRDAETSRNAAVSELGKFRRSYRVREKLNANHSLISRNL